ncbi:MAG TPA: hypothetical protein VIH17_11035 [Candidatus Acidoferrales bacterium]
MALQDPPGLSRKLLREKARVMADHNATGLAFLYFQEFCDGGHGPANLRKRKVIGDDSAPA